MRSPKRSGRQSGRTTVISCRVFRKGVCKKTTRNIILVNKSISSSHKCQQFCYATPGCAAFTHFEQSKKEDRKCVLFKDCNGKLSSCSNCIRSVINLSQHPVHSSLIPAAPSCPESRSVSLLARKWLHNLKSQESLVHLGALDCV